MGWGGPEPVRRRHSVSVLLYHYVWVPKYRRCILSKPVERMLGRLLREAAERAGCRLVEWAAPIDHVHVLVQCPPRPSPSRVANVLKGYTGYMLLRALPWLESGASRGSLWAPGYYVASVGHDAAIVGRYIAGQKRCC
ncbi:putative transposase [Pyrodictium delaneyi]|uniref:Putative transposase n=1 Tax=Pyrodictium delaneyi TaxID=1273541 RepID=A0A0N7JCZ5_9CREN|nr:putative transposase [Pyrodictium delaneyi]